MSNNTKTLLNQAFRLILESQELQPINYRDSDKGDSTPADYLFALVTHFKLSNSLPIALLHQLQYLAELQEREDQAIKTEIMPIYTGIRQTTSRHLKFNDFFTSNFKY